MTAYSATLLQIQSVQQRALAVPGLIRAADFTDASLTVSSGKITSVAGCWGTSEAFTNGTDGERPTVATGLGPNGEDIAKFDRTVGQRLFMTDTGAMNDFTLFVVGNFRVAGATTQGIVGNPSGGGSSYLRLEGGTGNLYALPLSGSRIQIALPGEADGFAAWNTKGISILGVRYSSSVDGGRMETWIDGVGPAVTTSVGTGGFNFGRIGSATGVATNNPLDAYLLALRIYNTGLTGNQISLVTSALRKFRSLRTYVDPATGSDSSATPWSTTTPLATISSIVSSNALRTNDRVVVKRGSITRIKRILEPGNLRGTAVVLDGGSWGDPSDAPAEIRPSVAPTPSLVSGTVYRLPVQYEDSRAITAVTRGNPTLVTFDRYVSSPSSGYIKFSGASGATWLNGQTLAFTTTGDVYTVSLAYDSTAAAAWTSGGIGELVSLPFLGTQGGAPTDHLYFIPTGVTAASFFSGEVTGREVCNVLRLRKTTWDAGFPGTIPVGYWSPDPTTHEACYNAGVAGSIEFPIYFGEGAAAVKVRADRNCTIEDFCIHFSPLGAYQVAGGHGVAIRLECSLNAGDGIDAANTSLGDGTSLLAIDCIAAWNGSGLTSPGVGGPGNGFSFHEDVHAWMLGFTAVMNDKCDVEHATGVTVIMERGLVYSKCPFSWSTTAGYAAGSWILRNTKAILPAGFEAYSPLAIRHNGRVDVGSDPAVMQIYGCTFVSLSNDATYLGIVQSLSAAVIRAKNNILVGFGTAQKAASGGGANFISDFNMLHGNTVDRDGVTAGADDLSADPMFADSPTDLRPDAISPALSTGTFIEEMRDFTGAMRGATPSIGAYEYAGGS